MSEKEKSNKPVKTNASLQESYNLIVKDKPELVQNMGFEYIEDTVFLEDFDEDEEWDLDPDNQVLPEEESKILTELKATEVNFQSPDYNQIIAKYKAKNNKTCYLTLGKFISAIRESNGLISRLEKLLNLDHRTIRVYLKRFPDAYLEREKFKVIGKQRFTKRPTDEAIAKALFQSRGIISKAALIVGMNSLRLSEYIKTSPFLTEKLKEVQEIDVEYTKMQRDKLIDGVLAKGIDFQGNAVVYERVPDGKAIENKLRATESKDSKAIDINLTITGVKIL